MLKMSDPIWNSSPSARYCPRCSLISELEYFLKPVRERAYRNAVEKTPMPITAAPTTSTASRR